MDDSSNEAAVNAFRGTEQYIHLGEWTNIEERKIVVFSGVHSNSTCYVIDCEGNSRRVQGKKIEEIHVVPGERVYAMETNIQFKPIKE